MKDAVSIKSVGIDLAATKEALESSGRNMAGWARSKGLDPCRIRDLFRNRYKKITKQELAALKADKLLVKKEHAA